MMFIPLDRVTVTVMAEVATAADTVAEDGVVAAAAATGCPTLVVVSSL